MELVHIALVTLVTNLVFGGVVAAFLLGCNDRLQLPPWPLALVGFGLGPFLVTVVLYYLLVLWHGVPHGVALVVPLLLMLFLGWRAGEGWGRLVAMVRSLPSLFLRDASMWFFLLGSLFLLVIAMVLLVNKPLVDHDVLEYGVQGRRFLHDKAIVYQRFQFDPSNGFHYVGLHGYSFPLLFTWEGLLGGITGLRSDLWVRGLTMWYGWLLVAFCWSLLRSVDRWLAVAGGVVLAAPVGFLFLLTIYHLDSYRIFFFTATVGVFIVLLQRPAFDRLLLFATLAGAVAFIHSVGAILVGMMFPVLLFVLGGPWGRRLRWLGMAVVVVLLMGGIHYVIDVLFGTGWIFQDIIWY